MRSISSVDVKGKKVLVRADLNCPVEDGKITSDRRIRAHAKSIDELCKRGARVIILSHQGRKGRDDYIPLEQHAKRLHQILGKDVHYVDDIIGEEALSAIDGLKDSDILVLSNVRHLKCETEHPDGDGEIVYHLAPAADYYVLDALSVAHRKHSSVVGFCRKMPCFAGDILAAEVDAVDRVRGGTDVTFILGGSKVGDSFRVMENWLSNGRAKEALVGGALAVLLLYADGHDIAGSKEYLENAKLMEKVPEAKEMLRKFDGKIVLPLDVGLSVRRERPDNESIKLERMDVDSDSIKEGQVWDIGPKTIERFVRVIDNSHFIVMNGPLGVYEVDEFSRGTREVLQAIADCDAFSLLGGGHTVAAIERFGIDRKHFNYVSLSGKALIKYLCGEELVGLKALEENERKFPTA